MYWQESKAPLLIQSTLITEAWKIQFKLIKNSLQQKVSRFFSCHIKLHPVKNFLPTNGNLFQTFNWIKTLHAGENEDILLSFVPTEGSQLELMS